MMRIPLGAMVFLLLYLQGNLFVSRFSPVVNVSRQEFASDVMHLVLIGRLALANMAVGCHQSPAEPIGSTGGVIAQKMDHGVEDMNVEYSRQRA
jgi:hypothetical protein